VRLAQRRFARIRVFRLDATAGETDLTGVILQLTRALMS
jgi:hypothetical protein